MIELICSSATVPKHMLDKLDEILYYQIKTLPEQYSDILLNERVWNICLYSSFQKNSLHNTEKIMENKYPELLGKDNEDDALIYGISDEERDDEDDEHNPTIVGGLYYQRP